MYVYDNTKDESYSILIDISDTGKSRPWADKKISSGDLSDSYKRLGFSSKCYRVKDCGSFLEFKRYTLDNSLKLHQANFCKVRLCPMCSWRRSLKIYGQVSKVMNEVVQIHDYNFLFLTLTCRNVKGKDLSITIDNLFHAFKKLSERKKFKCVVNGYFRALEVTHNLNCNSDSYDTYHPHFHVILAVNKSYFNSRNYIDHSEWVHLWQSCLMSDYLPIVDIRRFKSSTSKSIAKSIAETAKYTVKDNDYLIYNEKNIVDEEKTDNAVLVLDSSLSNRRLTAFGGVFRDIHRKLNLDDAESGDLIHVDGEEEIRDDLDYMIERYFWNIGYKQYYKI